MHNIFDSQWKARALAGQAAAVDLLAEHAIAPLYRFCFYRLGRDRHLCEDVVQDTLTQAMDQLRRYDPARSGGQIFGWLTGLARNHIRRVLAGRKAVSLEQLWLRVDRELCEALERLDRGALPDELLARQETRELVNAAMGQLPPHYEQALRARYVAGWTVRQIAQSMHSSEKAAESLLSRAREAFRAALAALVRNMPELNVETP